MITYVKKATANASPVITEMEWTTDVITATLVLRLTYIIMRFMRNTYMCITK